MSKSPDGHHRYWDINEINMAITSHYIEVKNALPTREFRALCPDIRALRDALATYVGDEIHRLRLDALGAFKFASSKELQAINVVESLTKALYLRDPEFNGRIIQHWVWQVKRKMLRPSNNIDFHKMLVFTGVQGCGKSRLVSQLLGPLHSSFIAEKEITFLNDSFQRKLLLDKYVIKIEELAGANKTDVEKIKDAISSDSVDVRVMRSQKTMQGKNRATFIGTSNRPLSTVILDETGMRRFVEIDTRPLKIYNWELINSLAYGALWRGTNENLLTGYLTKADLGKLASVESIMSLSDDIGELVHNYKLRHPLQNELFEAVTKSGQSFNYIKRDTITEFLDEYGGALVEVDLFYERVIKLAQAERMSKNQLTRKLKTMGVFKIHLGRKIYYLCNASQQLFSKSEVYDIYTRSENVRPVLTDEFKNAKVTKH